MLINTIAIVYAIILVIEAGSYFWPSLMKGKMASFNFDLFTNIILIILIVLFAITQLVGHERKKR